MFNSAVLLYVMPPRVWPVIIAEVPRGKLVTSVVFKTGFGINVCRFQDGLTPGGFRCQLACNKLLDMAFQEVHCCRALVENLQGNIQLRIMTRSSYFVSVLKFCLRRKILILCVKLKARCYKLNLT